MKIQKGNILKIGKEKYDVLSVINEIDWYDTEKDKAVGEHLEIQLHKIGDSSLHPTHQLKIYSENKKITLSKIIQEKHSKEIKNPRTRGEIFSFPGEKKINLKDIKIESESN